ESHPKNRVRFAHTAPFHIEIASKPLRPRAAEVDFLIRRVEEQIERSKDVLPPAALDEYREALQAYRAVKMSAGVGRSLARAERCRALPMGAGHPRDGGRQCGFALTGFPAPGDDTVQVHALTTWFGRCRVPLPSADRMPEGSSR